VHSCLKSAFLYVHRSRVFAYNALAKTAQDVPTRQQLTCALDKVKRKKGKIDKSCQHSLNSAGFCLLQLHRIDLSEFKFVRIVLRRHAGALLPSIVTILSGENTRYGHLSCCLLISIKTSRLSLDHYVSASAQSCVISKGQAAQ
jgi:hypothetical protein